MTLQDVTLDGDNPSLTSGIVAGGADLDARNGIVDNYYAGVFDNIHVHDVTVKNIYLRGIYAASGGSGFDFHDDTVENVQADPSSIAMFNYGGSGVFANNTVSDANDGISANHSRGTQFLNNVITASASGVHTDNSGDGGGSGDVIDGNSVSDCTTGGYGVWTFVPYIQPTVQNNVVTNCAVGLAATGSYVAVGTLFENNEVDGMNAAGSTGVYITTSTFYFASGNVEATLTGNIIKNNEDGFVFQSESGFTLTVDNLGNSITGNTTGTDTDGTGTYDVKMLGDWWGSASGPTNASNPSGTGDSVSDGIPFSPWLGIGTDSSGATGFQMASPMTWVAGPALCDGTCIQKAVDLASSGDTISALAGTFDEQVRDSGKSNLLINGAGVGSTVVQPSGVVANTTRINTNPAAVIFDVEDATGVTIQNLTADGSLNGLTGCTPDFLGFYYKNASGDLKHVAADHIKLAPALLGCQTGNGVYVESENPGFGAVNVNDASVTDYQKGGIVGNRVETVLSVTNSVITGIGPTDKIAQNGIQVGFSAQGVLTGNDISGNDYTPSTYASTAILLYQATGATITDNNMHDNQEGLFVQSTDGATVSGNQFTNTRDTATFVYLSNNGTYDDNTLTGMTGSYGMYFYDASTNNAVHDNAVRFNDYGVLVDYSGPGAPTGNTFNMNCIADNTVDGMATLGTVLTPVYATNNWWGKINGANPPGHGDTIDPAATINATPFLTAPVAGCPVPADGDGDGFVDASDNCPTVYNPDQANSDQFNYAANLPGTDSRGDACDLNIKGDGYLDSSKASLGRSVNVYCSVMRADVNGDGVVNILDLAAGAKYYIDPVPLVDPPSGLDVGIQRVNQNADNVINILDLSTMASYFLDSVTSCP